MPECDGMGKPEERLTILIADDHPVYRQGLERAIRERPELELVAASSDGREALERINELEPDVAVVDVRMPGLDGLKIVAAVQRDRPADQGGAADRLRGLRAPPTEALAQGAAGYVSKASDHTELCDSIVTAGRGETVIAPQFAAGIATEIQLRETSDRPALDRARGRGPASCSPRAGPPSGSAPSCTSPRRRCRPTSRTSTRS